MLCMFGTICRRSKTEGSRTEDREVFIRRYPCKTNCTSVYREAFISSYVYKTNRMFIYIDCM